MSEKPPRAHHDHVVEDLEATLLFLKRTRTELRQLRKVRVWTDRVNVIDVNGDFFENVEKSQNEQFFDNPSQGTLRSTYVAMNST